MFSLFNLFLIKKKKIVWVVEAVIAGLSIGWIINYFLLSYYIRCKKIENDKKDLVEEVKVKDKHHTFYDEYCKKFEKDRMKYKWERRDTKGRKYELLKDKKNKDMLLANPYNTDLGLPIFTNSDDDFLYFEKHKLDINGEFLKHDSYSEEYFIKSPIKIDILEKHPKWDTLCIKNEEFKDEIKEFCEFCFKRFPKK